VISSGIYPPSFLTLPNNQVIVRKPVHMYTYCTGRHPNANSKCKLIAMFSFSISCELDKKVICLDSVSNPYIHVSCHLGDCNHDYLLIPPPASYPNSTPPFTSFLTRTHTKTRKISCMPLSIYK